MAKANQFQSADPNLPLATTGSDEAVADAPRAVPVNRANRFAHIDALRAFAVLVVLVQHAGVRIVPGDAGVTVFFVISGFIITTILMKERDEEGRFRLRRFYLRRFLKLAPPFTLAILIPTIIYAIFRPVSFVAVLSQVFFSYNWVQIYANSLSEMVLPGTNVVWSLAVEEQFYIAFALVWLLMVRQHHWRRTLFVASCAIIVIANLRRVQLVLAHESSDHLLRGTDVRMDAIAWGIITALAYRAYRDGALPQLRVFSKDWVPVLAGVVFLVAAGLRSDQYEQLWRLAVHPLCGAAVILYGLLPTGSSLQNLLFRVSTTKVVSTIGLASYSIYIAHYPVMEPLFFAAQDRGISLVAVVPVLLLIGVALGVVLYLAVEVPVLRFRKRRGI